MEKTSPLENIMIGAFLGVPLTLGAYSQIEPKMWMNITEYIANSGHDALYAGIITGTALGFLGMAYLSGRKK